MSDGIVPTVVAGRSIVSLDVDAGCGAFLHSAVDTLFQPVDIILSRRIEGIIDIEGRQERFPLRTGRVFPNGKRDGEDERFAGFTEGVKMGPIQDGLNSVYEQFRGFGMEPSAHRTPQLNGGDLEGLSIAFDDVSSHMVFPRLHYGGILTRITH